MTTIRCYDERDAPQVGRLIADTYSKFNLEFVPHEQLGLFLGPFRFAESQDTVHQEAIARVIKSALLFVAEDDGEIVGVLRGRKERLASLFVRGDHHRQGIGRKLVERFEAALPRLGNHSHTGSRNPIRRAVLPGDGIYTVDRVAHRPEL